MMVFMELTSFLWQFILIIAILVFGVEIGITSLIANLSKKLLLIISVIYGGSILILSLIASYSNEFCQLFLSFSPVIFLINACILIIAGFYLINNWNDSQRDMGKINLISIFGHYTTVICSILFLILNIEYNISVLGFIAAIFLIIVIILSYYATEYLKFNKSSYTLISNYMLYLGAFLLLLILVYPNLLSVMEKGASELMIGDLNSLSSVLIVIVFLVIVGYLLYRYKEGILK